MVTQMLHQSWKEDEQELSQPRHAVTMFNRCCSGSSPPWCPSCAPPTTPHARRCWRCLATSTSGSRCGQSTAV